MADLTVSIINFNAGDYLTQCLSSLKKISNEVNQLEVFVVDNHSTDGSIEKAIKKFPHVNFILNKENFGFGRANNQVLGNLKTEYVLLLNPDSRVISGTIERMLLFMEKNKFVGASSCRVEKKDGSLDWASHRGFPTPLASFMYFFLKNDRLYHLTDCDMRIPHQVDSISGAFFLTRKSVLKKVGLFDTDFFLYGEDLDLCYRIKKAGFKIMYVPEVKIIHLKGLSSGIKSHSKELTATSSESRLKAFNSFYKTMFLFYKKNLSPDYPTIINWLVYLGINLKWWLSKRKMVV